MIGKFVFLSQFYVNFRKMTWPLENLFKFWEITSSKDFNLQKEKIVWSFNGFSSTGSKVRATNTNRFNSLRPTKWPRKMIGLKVRTNLNTFKANKMNGHFTVFRKLVQGFEHFCSSRPTRWMVNGDSISFKT